MGVSAGKGEGVAMVMAGVIAGLLVGETNAALSSRTQAPTSTVHVKEKKVARRIDAVDRTPLLYTHLRQRARLGMNRRLKVRSRVISLGCSSMSNVDP